MLGCYAVFLGDLAGAQPWFEESVALFRELEDRAGMAEALADFGMLFVTRGDFGAASPLFNESLAVYRELGHAPAISGMLFFRGISAYAQGDLGRARDLWEESLLLLRREEGSAPSVQLLVHLAMVTLDLGEAVRAGAYLAECLLVCREIGDRWATHQVLEVAARLAAGEGQQVADMRRGGVRAAQLFGAAEALRERHRVAEVPHIREHTRRHVAAARAQLDAHEFEQAWAVGEAMTLEQAIAYALAAAGPPR